MADLRELARQFEERFGSAPRIFRAPGRVNLIGEHTDYNEGFVLPFAIDKTAKVAVRIRHDSRVRLLSTFGGQGLVEADVDALVPEAAKGWTKYPLGVAWVPTLLAGLIMITGGLAARKRLSSTWYWSKPELIT